jgi:hypothetical protein
MKKQNIWHWFLAGMLAALLLAGIAFGIVDHAKALAVPAASADTRANIFDSSPVVIPAAAFSSDGFDPGSMFFSFWDGSLRGGNTNTCFKAPVYIPLRARMIDMWTSLYDNDPGANLWVRLFRVANYTGVVDELAYVATTGAADYIQTPWDWIDNPSVQYPEYSYYLGGCAESSETRLYSVRIYYELRWIYFPIVSRKSGTP